MAEYAAGAPRAVGNNGASTPGSAGARGLPTDVDARGDRGAESEGGRGGGDAGTAGETYPLVVVYCGGEIRYPWEIPLFAGGGVAMRAGLSSDLLEDEAYTRMPPASVSSRRKPHLPKDQSTFE